MNKSISYYQLNNITRRIFILVFFCFLCGSFAFAQSRRLNDGSTPLGIAPGSPAGAFSLSNLDTINPYNGNLNFRLPLINIGGRGSSGYTITLPINYRWAVFHHYEQQDLFRHYPTTYRPDYAIRPNYRAGNFEVRNVEENNCNQYGQGIITTLTTIVFTAADGTEYEFRSEAFNGAPAGANCQVGIGASRGTVWKTSDGSFLTFISDTAISDLSFTSAHNLFGYLMFPDGTKYRVEAGKIVWIRDRNGNVTTFTYVNTYSNSPVAKVTDPIGREITFTYDVQDNGQYGLHDQITYKGVSGQTRTIRISYKSLSEVLRSDQTIQTYQALFPDLDHVGTSPPHNPTNQIAALWLPNGQAYRFYYNSYNELARVELPTGGAYEYDWGASYPSTYNPSGVVYVSGSNGSFPEIYRQVLTKRIYPEGGTGNTFALKTTFSQSQEPQGSATSSRTVEQRDASNNLLGQTKHYFHGNPIPYYESNIYFKPEWNEGREYQTEIFDIVSGTPVLKRRGNQTWQKGAGTGYNEGNARVVETAMTLVDTNQISKTTSINPTDGNIGFDQFNNPTDVWEYDYGTGAPGQFLRRTHTDYVTDTNYTSHTGAHLRNLPLQTWVSSDINGNNKSSLAQVEYDNYNSDTNHAPLVSRSNVSGHDTTNYGLNHIRRGNVTAVTSYEDAQNQMGAITVYSQYDILGNVVKTIDAKGYISTVDYTDRFGSADGEAQSNTAPSQLNGLSTFALPTSATNPLGWTAYTQIDYFTGQPVNTEDINGVISKFVYNDVLDRPTQSVTAVGTSLEMQSNIVYDDANRRIETKSDLNTLNDNLLKSESFYDGLGRTIETRRYESDGGYIAAKSVPFEVVQDPETSIYRVAIKVSNPYRPLAGEQAVWTTSLADSIGRGIKVITPDSAIVKTEYSGNTVTVTDQAGKKRRSVTNALGQLIRIDEPNDAGQLDTGGSPVQPTSYTYDVLNNLTTVSQGVQTRTFVYDSLSRLKQATNPESGTISYIYDNNGNLTRKTDARNIKTIYDYDALNRVMTRCYTKPNPSVTPSNCASMSSQDTSLDTLPVAYTYDDTNIAFSKGRLTKVDNGFSKTEYTEFDRLGRVKKSKQTTDGTAYNELLYAYNLSGALIEQTYPSGRVVKNILDADGDLAQVESARTASGSFKVYANSFTYTSAGAVSSLRLGNGRWESVQFNSRLQPTQIALGTSTGATNLLKLDYEYGALNLGTGETIAGTNNGNIAKQTITVQNTATANGFSATQYYDYDSLDRIKTASENLTPNGQATYNSWQQNFSYDRYGNRNFVEATTTTLPKYCNNNTEVCPADRKVLNPSISANDNRLNPDQDGDQTNDYLFDAAGNMTKDALSRIFIYDAENKQTEVKNSQNATIGQYFYDGDGKRVKKYVPSTGETTIFVYDASGKMVAEYSTIVEPQATAKVSYLTNDHLGSPRIMIDQNGQTVSRRDFQPFGEEIATSHRTQNLGYTDDTVRQKFTSYERDDETDLDYAQARYYKSSHGRFTSVDPMMASAAADEPQSWNRYVYVDNNPLVFVDNDGLLKRKKDKSLDFRVIGQGESISNKKRFQASIGYLLTDNGTRIEAQFSIDRNSRAGDANCHGLTFGDGQFGIDNSQINSLLKNDGYRAVTNEQAQEGDVVVYEEAVYAKNGDDIGEIKGWRVVHSATVVETQGGIQVAGINGTEMQSTTSSVENGTATLQRSTNPVTGEPAEIRATVYTKPSLTAEERAANVERAKTYDKSKNEIKKREQQNRQFTVDPGPQ